MQNLIVRNQSPENFRLMISYFGEFRNTSSVQSKELEVRLLGFMASVYKENCLDPSDKPPSLAKSILRLLDFLIGYFKTKSEPVQMACAQAWADVHTYCMARMTREDQAALAFDTLEEIILGGSDRFAQVTAAHCVFQLLSRVERTQDKKLLSILFLKTINLFLVGS